MIHRSEGGVTKSAGVESDGVCTRKQSRKPARVVVIDGAVRGKVKAGAL